MTITAVNDAPVAVADGYAVDEDGTLTVDWWDVDWTRRQELTFDNSGQAQDLDDFAVLVVLNSGNVDYADIQDQGQDLRFFDTDGTPLAYEIEEWNESGDSLVWVRVPRIDAGSSTDSSSAPAATIRSRAASTRSTSGISVGSSALASSTEKRRPFMVASRN